MKTILKSALGNRVVQVVLFVLVAAVGLGGAAYYAQNHGMLNGNGNNEPNIVWLTQSNVASELNITQQSASSAPVAAPSKPVLLVECPTEACESSQLGLRSVMAKYGDKVEIVAIDPYSQSAIDQALNQMFITPSLEQGIAPQIAALIAGQQYNTSNPTQAQVQAVESSPNFQQEVQTIVSTPAELAQVSPQMAELAGAAYPKFFFFAAKSFALQNAATGAEITSASDLEGFISSTLNPPAASGASTTGSGNSATASTPSAPANSSTQSAATGK